MFYDDHNIDEQYQQIKKLLQEVEIDLYRFVGRTKNDSAAKRVRANLNEIKRRVFPLRSSIQKQRQDNKGEY